MTGLLIIYLSIFRAYSKLIKLLAINSEYYPTLEFEGSRIICIPGGDPFPAPRRAVLPAAGDGQLLGGGVQVRQFRNHWIRGL